MSSSTPRGRRTGAGRGRVALSVPVWRIARRVGRSRQRRSLDGHEGRRDRRASAPRSARHWRASLAVVCVRLAIAFTAGATLWAFGNGGSSTDAQDVVHTFLDPAGGGRPLPALCLTSDAAIITALSNDVGYDVVFARQIRAFGRPGDIAFGLSTSGGSTQCPQRIRRGEEGRSADCRRRGLRRWPDGRLGQPRPPVRGVVLVGASGARGADHDLPRALGAHPARACRLTISNNQHGLGQRPRPPGPS